jgi:uncharacterized membrane protein YuzA (DUF378 family)
LRRSKLGDLVNVDSVGLDDEAAGKTVVKSRARSFGGRLVIWYDPSQVSEETMMKEIDGFLTDFFARSRENDNSPVRKKRKHAWNVKAMGLQLLGCAVLGGFLMYALLRKIFASPVSQRMYSVAGVAAIIAAIPLLWQAVKERKRNKRFGLIDQVPMRSYTGFAGLA